MNYLSVCSGIEAATVAWHPLGWNAFAYSEIEKFPCQVLKHHYPQTPNFGDMTNFKDWPDATLDILVGGTPCQSFSVAGLRKGLDDPRGNLMLTYLAIADKYRPKWLVWENVPGVLSSNRGRDFASLLRGLAELGYGFAYRVLDAQYFGVAQRRRRVFVVACLGDWRSAAAVLFERDSLCGNPAPSREARQTVAGTITAGAFSGGAGGRPEGAAGGHFQPVSTHRMVAFGEYEDDGLASSMKARDYKDATDLVVQPTTYGIPGNWIGRKPENGGNAVEPMHDVAPCLTKADQHGVAHPIIVHGTQDPCTSDIAFAQGRNNGGENVLVQPQAYLFMGESVYRPMAVRRLTPRECERLQGFQDDYTNIPGASDNARYKALGNSMAVPVMSWIGERIAAVDAIADVKAVA